MLIHKKSVIDFLPGPDLHLWRNQTAVAGGLLPSLQPSSFSLPLFLLLLFSSLLLSALPSLLFSPCRAALLMLPHLLRCCAFVVYERIDAFVA